MPKFGIFAQNITKFEYKTFVFNPILAIFLQPFKNLNFLSYFATVSISELSLKISLNKALCLGAMKSLNCLVNVAGCIALISTALMAVFETPSTNDDASVFVEEASSPSLLSLSSSSLDAYASAMRSL